MRLLPRIAFAVSLVLIAAAVRAGDLHFLNQSSVDPVALLAEPAALDTPEMKAELDEVIHAEESRTPEETARAKAEKKLHVFVFADVVGDWFTAEHLPVTAAFFKEVADDSKYFTDEAKTYFNRPRPLNADGRAKVKALADDSDGGYPSGHATRGILFATILGELMPDKRAALLQRGRQIGWDRILVGAHFPSDVTAGRVLGKALARQMLANPKFQEKLAQVRAELAHAHTLVLTP